MATVSYVPILKGKANSLAAFAKLPPQVRAGLRPLFDQPFPTGDAGAAEETHAFLTGLARKIPLGQSCLVDFYGLADDALTASGDPLIAHGIQLLRQTRLNATPTLSVERGALVFQAARPAVHILGNGCCLRVDGESLDAGGDAAAETVRERVDLLKLPAGQCDLLIDLRTVKRLEFDPLEGIVDFVAATERAGPFRSLILAGSSALLDVGAVPQDGTLDVPRSEVAIWDRVVFELAGTSIPIFADYGIANPEFAVAGGRLHTNAKIRYTHGGVTTYFRGHGLFRPVTDFAQYRELAQRAMTKPYYDGAAYSFGDDYIARVATAPGPRGFGNLGSWVLADANRHMTVVAKQMANRAARVVAGEELLELSGT